MKSSPHSKTFYCETNVATGLARDVKQHNMHRPRVTVNNSNATVHLNIILRGRKNTN